MNLIFQIKPNLYTTNLSGGLLAPIFGTNHE